MKKTMNALSQQQQQQQQDASNPLERSIP